MAEAAKYLLPTRDDGSGEIDEMGLTVGELEYMKENQTLELPPNFFRRLHKTRRHNSLEFTGFKVQDTFPQNIVRLKSGSIVFCDKFLPPTKPGESPRISGFNFWKVLIEFLSIIHLTGQYSTI
jgi:hypothetical protein